MDTRFVGRRKELAALREKYEKDSFQMAVIYGRRRIGKTTLVNEFISERGCRAVSFIALERTEQELLEMMGETVLAELAPSLLGSVRFDSFEKLFSFIAEAAGDERIIFFIDEYPYLAEQCKYMNSLLQKYVDHDWKATKLFFILCGSMVSFMRDEVLGESAPLHGRSDIELKLRPFDYRETGEFLPGYSDEDKAVVYGLTSGVAKYIDQFDPKKTLDENIKKEFFSSTGYFTEEQIRTVITGDKLNPAAYNAIISAIASGHTKYNEIASAAGLDDISYYLKTLVSSELVEKRMSKRPYYCLNDGLIHFWFQYVNRASSLINAGKGDIYYENEVKPRLHEYMGKVFEEMARQYIFSHIGTEKMPVMLTEVTDYQCSVKDGSGELIQVELDLLGSNGKQYVMAGECKFRNKPFDEEDLDHFLKKLEYVPVVDPVIILFSLSGFSESVKKNRRDMILVDIEEMYAQ